MAVRILIADVAVTAVNHQFAVLILRDGASGIDGHALRIVLGSVLPVSRPSTFVRNDVLALAHLQLLGNLDKKTIVVILT